MADTVGDLVARLRADTSDFDEGMKRAGQSMQATADKMISMGKSMSIGVTLPLVAIGKASFDAASDLNESLSKSNTIFGENAKAIEQWATGAAQSFGQSKQQALEAAASFGNMFTQLGVGIDTATNMSQKMVELASDFASFHNADITEVLQAQAAAFRGEYDALQRFVPTINAAAVEMKALAMTGKENAAELTNQEKAMAAYQLMIEGAGKAMGDFDRTADGAANTLRRSNAEMTDAMAKIGASLLPIVSTGAEAIAGLAGAFAELPQPVQEAAVYMGLLAAAIGPVMLIGGNLIKLGSGIGSAFSAIGDAAGALAKSAGAAGEAIKTMFGSFAAAGAVGLAVGALVAIGAALNESDDQWANATEAAQRWGNQVSAAAKASGDELGFLKDKQRDLNKDIREMAGASDVSADAAFKLKARYEELNGQIDKVKQSNREAAAAEKERQGDLQGVAQGTMAVAQASDAAKQSIQQMQNVILGAQGGALGYRAATLQYADAVQHLHEVQLFGATSAGELERAELAVDQASQAVATSAAAAAQSHRDLAAGGSAAAAGAVNLRAKLEETRAAMGDATGEIGRHIFELDLLIAAAEKVPPSKGIRIDLQGAAEATYLMAVLQDQINGIQDKTVRVSVQADVASSITSGIFSDRNAKANIVPVAW